MTKLLKLFAVAFSLLFISVPSVFAECYCACVNNKETKICENSWDSNYVYCSGTYCSASLDLPAETPFERTTDQLYALIDLDSNLLISVPYAKDRPSN